MDQLFAPDGVIQDAQALAAAAYGAQESFFLVNGSSGGLIAGLLALCQPNDLVVVPRNCHQSIIHGLVLSGARPIWITPPIDSDSGLAQCITAEQVRLTLKKYPEAKGVIAVSPSYEGICGDISALAAIAHHHDIPLIVDEAHGAHFNFHPGLPTSALHQGADIVVQSWHKTLGALSQASVLHLQGERIGVQQLKQALTFIQTSSPNYLLLASLDASRQQMALRGEALLTDSIAIALKLRHSLQSLETIGVLQSTQNFDIDPLRLTLLLGQSHLSGFELDERLSTEFGIIAELPSQNSLTFVLGQGITENQTQNLRWALEKIDRQYRKIKPESEQSKNEVETPKIGKVSKISPRQAYYSPSKSLDRQSAIGQICKHIICPYPPGIPLLFPGEEISQQAVQTLNALEAYGCQIIGCSSESIDIIPQSMNHQK
ncbi:MAG: aminotransferase class I/II-fold pyridoxal phosphate-dependent enzyme [Acaryochloridaceae cyanobacterium RL_2_7]|nr:aminotransferase class I/II-fold pyridoxal phosphate-dependent enzyme [Acaryochloridaceae cyanobacterium RL_2_7]